ncbi:hypothetical protein [Edaphobacter modestus]|uniref:hypothetical protein n=1 Tax=Edaphobacter modestus TaxID=388466 RepID=UPI00102CE2D8|nr:hypothetical protein [Edaphobacter modestus]
MLRVLWQLAFVLQRANRLGIGASLSVVIECGGQLRIVFNRPHPLLGGEGSSVTGSCSLRPAATQRPVHTWTTPKGVVNSEANNVAGLAALGTT